MSGLLHGFADAMNEYSPPAPTSDRPDLRRIDIEGAHTIRTIDRSYPVLAVNEENVRVRTASGWLDVAFGDVLGVTK